MHCSAAASATSGWTNVSNSHAYHFQVLAGRKLMKKLYLFSATDEKTPLIVIPVDQLIGAPNGKTVRFRANCENSDGVFTDTKLLVAIPIAFTSGRSEKTQSYTSPVSPTPIPYKGKYWVFAELSEPSLKRHEMLQALLQNTCDRKILWNFCQKNGIQLWSAMWHNVFHDNPDVIGSVLYSREDGMVFQKSGKVDPISLDSNVREFFNKSKGGKATKTMSASFTAAPSPAKSAWGGAGSAVKPAVKPAFTSFDALEDISSYVPILSSLIESRKTPLANAANTRMMAYVIETIETLLLSIEAPQLETAIGEIQSIHDILNSQPFLEWMTNANQPLQKWKQEQQLEEQKQEIAELKKKLADLQSKGTASKE